MRVPPSAWSTSQSTMIDRSPRTIMSQTDRSDRPMRRWISWVRPEGLPSLTSRADPLGRGAGQHRVLGGDPALAAAPHPAGHVVLDRRGAQDPGPAEADQHRAGAHVGEVALEGDGPQLVGQATVDAGLRGAHGDVSSARAAPTVKVRPGSAISTALPNVASAAGPLAVGIDARQEVGEHQATGARRPRPAPPPRRRSGAGGGPARGRRWPRSGRGRGGRRRPSATSPGPVSAE